MYFIYSIFNYKETIVEFTRFSNLYYTFGSLYVSLYVCMLFMAGQTTGPIALKFTELGAPKSGLDLDENCTHAV